MHTSQNSHITQIIRMNRQLNRRRLSITALRVRHTLTRRHRPLIIKGNSKPTFNRCINNRRTRIIANTLMLLTKVTRPRSRPRVKYRILLSYLRPWKLCPAHRHLSPVTRIVRLTIRHTRHNKGRTRPSRSRPPRRHSKTNIINMSSHHSVHRSTLYHNVSRPSRRRNTRSLSLIITNSMMTRFNSTIMSNPLVRFQGQTRPRSNTFKAFSSSSQVLNT